MRQSFTLHQPPLAEGVRVHALGLASPASRCARSPRPITGAKTSSAAFTDSITMHAVPAASSLPDGGSSTKTTSESLFWA